MKPVFLRLQGSITILLALSLTALLGMMALAIDITRLFIAQSQLQLIADSCALAAIAALPCAEVDASKSHCGASDYAIAANAAQKLASMNEISSSPSNITLSYPQSNRVNCRVELLGFMPTLMQVFGLGVQYLQAQSTAAPWPQQSVCSNCGTTRFSGALNTLGNKIPTLVQ
jgi:Putative Flp pilus-assembly TadE/G-like